MTSIAVVGISTLVTCDEHLGRGSLGLIEDAAVVVDDGRIAWVGERRALPEGAGHTRLDAGGRAVVPGFVDSHAHLVFAGDRTDDYLAAVAARAGYRPQGIRSTVRATRAASTEELEDAARRRREEALRSGTTTMECKSGYGLTVDDERRSCEVASAVADHATFLGAHVVPEEHEADPDAYVALVTGPMLEACAPLVEAVDVFCERGAFDEAQSRTVLRAAARLGLRTRVHANQLGHGPGVRLAVEERSASADHCTFLDQADVDALASSSTVATLLPITELMTATPHADGRRLLDAGATVALASNCNAGSSASTSMPLAIALAVRCLGLTFDEALVAATRGGATSLGRDDVGVLAAGCRADLVVLDTDTPAHLASRPGVDLVAAVIRRGEIVRDGPLGG